MRTCFILLIALALAACAETDPYKRADAAATGALTDADVALAFNTRWPARFKCVQTVTLDFRIQTRTLMGYLIVDQPGRFRLQGMTEQGLKLFDVIGDGNTTTVVFAVEEFDAKIIDSIARDIRRVFLTTAESATGGVLTTLGDFGLLFVDTEMNATNAGTKTTLLGRHGDLRLNLVGEPPSVDWYEYRQSERALYRVGQYEWREFHEVTVPSTIVLREPGIQSDGPAYKLTIKITELAVRDKPWPDKMFNPEKDD